MPNFKQKGLGLQQDLPDIRDLMFLTPGVIKKERIFPKSLDYRTHPAMPPIYDQGSLGSCTAQAVGALCDFKYTQDFPYTPSTLFLYYVTRLKEGNESVDSGATIRNTIKAANDVGVCLEEYWPYAIHRFNIQPSTDAFDIASRHQALKYSRLRQDLNTLKECLYTGNLFAFGIGVYDGLYNVTKDNSVLAIPTINDKLYGGHALCAVGFDDDIQSFIVRNSWGTDFGRDGYFYIPYQYMLNSQLAMDFWTINLVEV